MAIRLKKLLEKEGERLLWQKRPPSIALRVALLAVNVFVILLATLISVAVGFWVRENLTTRVLVGLMFWLACITPLIIWTVKRRHSVRPRSNATYFITDRRLGVFYPAGELRQMPILPGLTWKVVGDVIEFEMAEQSPVSFGGLSENERQLVEAVVKAVLGTK